MELNPRSSYSWYFFKITILIIHSLYTDNHFLSVICSPLLRDVVALGLGSANLTLSMSTSLVIIGGAWCIYRPGLALLILVVAALPFIRAAVKHQSTVGHSRRPNGYRRSSADWNVVSSKVVWDVWCSFVYCCHNLGCTKGAKDFNSMSKTVYTLT